MANPRFPFKHRYFTRRGLTPLNKANEIIRDWFFGVQSGSATISIVSHSADKISDETGKTVCSVVFSTDVGIDSWEARATDESQTPGIGVGTVVGSGSSVSAGGNANFDVVYSELVNGDRMYQITVYANIGGVWYG